MCDDKLKNKNFGYFYDYFCVEALKTWKQEETLREGKKLVEDGIVLWNVYRRLKEIPLRTLIYDIGRLRKEKRLKGNTPEEQYQSYQEDFLKNRKYIEGLLEKYSELDRLLRLRTKQTLAQLEEITDSLSNNREQIQRTFQKGRKFVKIKDISMVSADSHKGGKTAGKVTFDDGLVLYYKPHSIRKEIEYQELVSFIYLKCGLSVRKIKYLDLGDHGWEEEVRAEPCKNEEELKRYYERMGAQLFLAYLLGTTDLHGENMIACGEFPVVVDAETVPGMAVMVSGEGAEVSAERIIRNSVLRTGILPAGIWGNRANIALGAIHSEQEQEIEVEILGVRNERSADMEIFYKNITVLLKNSMPTIQGNSRNPAEYTEEVCRGFEKAFRVWRQKQEALCGQIRELFQKRTRIIRRNTQAYGMLLSVSLHPDFLATSSRRKEVLQHLRKWDKERGAFGKEIQDYEIESLYDLDIPFFEAEGNTLYTGEGTAYPGYFQDTPWKLWNTYKKEQGEMELQIQHFFIRTSMENLKRKKEQKEEQILEGKRDTLETAEKLLSQIAESLTAKAISDEEDISWIGIYRDEKGGLLYGPIGWDFYNGLSGIAVFLAGLSMRDQGERYREQYQRILKKITLHTERMREGRKGQRTGLMLGTGSLLYSYLLQLQITGNGVFLDYAEREARELKHSYQQDTSYDLISGNAGAIYALTLLYKAAGKEEYLALAEEIGEWLWQRSVKTACGRGWQIGSLPMPLTGMSHGNSGFMLAYSQLLKYTGEEKYVRRLKELLSYENHYYSESLKNWLDLRAGESIQNCQNTWCHGAPGILIGRMAMQELKPFQKNEEVGKDIRRAVDSLIGAEYGEGMCLCHGRCGNWMILKKYLQKHPENTKAGKELKRLSEDIIGRCLAGRGFRITEWETTGIMTGISGIGMTVLKMIEAMKNERTRFP